MVQGMHRKDIFIIILVVLVLALLADDTNQIKNSLSNIGDSIEARGNSKSLTGAAMGGTETDGVDDIVQAAENWQKKGNSQLKAALSAYENVEYSDCLNRCLSARNYYGQGEEEYSLALEELEEVIEDNNNKVLDSFLEKTLSYYTCSSEINSISLELCETMENACLSYSRDETSKGNNYDNELEEKQAILEEKQTECEDILNN